MKLFTWGANTYGQLGLGYKCEQILTPTEINLKNMKDSQIIQISGGAGHTIILDEKGSLYSSGWNTKGQLGQTGDSLEFKQIKSLSNYKIKQISCGWDFCAAISEFNDIFVFGSNNFKQLGLPKKIKYTSEPTLLKDITGKFVSCGIRHMAIVTTEGKIVMCGTGSKGQLGILHNGNPIRETEVQYIPNLNDIKQVSCGQNHTLALKNDGTIYSWGNNKHGQLGFNPNIQENYFIPQKINFDISVLEIFAGWTHSGILTENGDVYIFGRNTYGQLGSERENWWEPTKVDISSVKNLSFGSEHNLAVNSEGKLFCWGWNEHGNCGTGNTEDVREPKEIMKDFDVIFASCGTGQSFALTR